MEFNDEDLKRLKEVISRKKTVTWSPAAMRDLLPLLTRLSAAEKCIEIAEQMLMKFHDEFCVSKIGTCGCEDEMSIIEGWRKACGK